MIRAGARRLCFVISPGKSDIVGYFGAGIGAAQTCYVVQPRPSGLCDAVFRALAFVLPDEPVLVGLPDTVWFPVDGFSLLSDDALSFLLFPVRAPELFDAVVTDDAGRVREIQVKHERPATSWVWGAIRARASVLHALHALWLERGQRDEYLGTLVNAWIASGGEARAVRGGEDYVDVGTLHGYREAIRLLGERGPPPT